MAFRIILMALVICSLNFPNRTTGKDPLRVQASKSGMVPSSVRSVSESLSLFAGDLNYSRLAGEGTPVTMVSEALRFTSSLRLRASSSRSRRT